MKKVQTTALTDVISTSASVALPEIVSIFLSKYETDLYERKAVLSDNIIDANQQIKDHNKIVAKAAKFSDLIGIKIPKLGFKSVVDTAPEPSWTHNEIRMQIGLVDTDSIRDEYVVHQKAFTKPIGKPDIKQHSKLINNLEELKASLSRILHQITDMSRKERQVKARISEIRLKEQGLESFINSPEMLQLVKID